MKRALPSLLSVLASLLICFIAIAIARGNLSVAGNSFLAMTWGAFGDWPRMFRTGEGIWVLRPLGEAGIKAALLCFTGLSVAAAFRVGLFNIGAQGQLIVGAISAAVIGAMPLGPAPVHITLALLAAGVSGALWALPAAVLKLWRGVHEVISTIMLNWIAVSLVESWLVTGPLRATASGVNSISGTAEIAPTAMLPRLLSEGSRLNLGFLLAVIAALLMAAFLSRTRAGFEWKVVGLSPPAAESSGVAVRNRVLQAMAVSGALAGLAGAVLVLGTEFKYPATLGGQYGFDGIAVALIGGSHPIGVLLSALFFGGLRAGGTRMQLFGVHKSFPELIQGLALLFVAGKRIWQVVLERAATSRRRRAAETAPGASDAREGGDAPEKGKRR